MSAGVGLFSSRFGRAMFGIAGCLVLVSVVLALYGGQLNGPTPTETDTYSRNAIGHRAFFDFTQRMGYQSTRLTALQHQMAAPPIFFIEPQRQVYHLGVKHKLRDTLRRRYEKGLSSVLILPKWQLRRNNGNEWAQSRSASSIKAWLQDILPEIAPKLQLQRLLANADIKRRDAGALTSQTLQVSLHQATKTPPKRPQKTRKIELQILFPQRFQLRQTPKKPALRWRRNGASNDHDKAKENAPSKHHIRANDRVQLLPTGARSLADARIEIVLGAGKQGYALRITAPRPAAGAQGTDPTSRGDLWLISDPDLMHNFNLHRGQHALFWYDLLHRRLGSRQLLFDECYHGHVKSFSLTEELGRFPHILFVLQGLFLLGLFGWHGARRFGVHRTIQMRQGRGPQEIIDITAWVLVCGQRIEQVAASYVERVLQDTAERLQLKGPISPQLARQIDQMAQRKGIEPQADMLLSWLDMTRRKLKQKPKDALRLAHKAWQFRQAMLSHRHDTTKTRDPRDPSRRA